jgi:hypothetical protein
MLSFFIIYSLHNIYMCLEFFFGIDILSQMHIFLHWIVFLLQILISRLYRPAPHLLVKYQVAWSVPKYDLYEVWEDEIFYVRVEHLLNVVGLYDVSSQTNHIPKVDSYNLASKDCVSLLLYPIVEFWFWVFCFNNSLSCFLLIPSIVH